MKKTSVDNRILSYHQSGQVKLQCMISLNRLFPDKKGRKRFDSKWESFIDDSCNKNIYRLQGEKLKYGSEQLIPAKTSRKPPLLLVLGNPASESILRGMFFATDKDGKELRFWGHILEKAKLLPRFPTIICQQNT